jgi:hypothetical protein
MTGYEVSVTLIRARVLELSLHRIPAHSEDMIDDFKSMVGQFMENPSPSFIPRSEGDATYFYSLASNYEDSCTEDEFDAFRYRLLEGNGSPLVFDDDVLCGVNVIGYLL